MAVKKTASGTVDKRTKEGKAIAARMAKARAARAKSSTTTKKKTTLKKLRVELLTNAPKRARQLQHAWQRPARQRIAFLTD